MKESGEIDEELVIAEQLEMPKLKKEPKSSTQFAKPKLDPEITKIVETIEQIDAIQPVREPIVHVNENTTVSCRPAKHTHLRRIAGILLGLTFVGLLIWAGSIYSQKGSLASYMVGNIPVSASTPDDIQAKTLLTAFDTYRFTINSQTKVTTHRPADAGITVDAKKTLETVRQAHSKHTLLENLAWWQTYSLPLSLSVDEGKLADFIAAHLVQTTTSPVNATIATETGEIVVTDETNGAGLTIDQPRQTLVDAISQLRPSAQFTLTQQTVPAKVTRESIKPVLEEIKTIASIPITVAVEGETIAASAATITSWVDPIKEIDTQARFEINSGKVQAWLDGVAANHTMSVRNELRAKDSSGAEIILTRGRTGYKVTNDDQIAKDIVASLEKRAPYTKTLEVTRQPYKVINATIYDKWLIADLSNHMIYAYERDTLVKSFPMSAGAPETPTVVGTFAIYQKFRSQTMRGPNTDGTSYNVPNVEWVSYFHEAYAIHGNYWRPASTFGSLNTSHGCIGLPNVSSRWIYEWAPIGTPVITHN